MPSFNVGICGVDVSGRFVLYWNGHFSDQYNETKFMHFLYNLLRIKGRYMFRALLAHLQEALHKRQVFILRVCYVSWLMQRLLVLNS
jgi:hypothetical protein